MVTVAGIFDSRLVANQGLINLLGEGFTRDDISLVMTDKTHKKLFNSTDDEADRTAKGAISGAAIGGALGAILAGFTVAGGIIVTGGTLLVAGPIIAILSGGGVGAVAGGLSGALIRAGFAADEANHYEKEIKAGKAVIIVHASDDRKAMRARAILMDSGAIFKAA